ncbi:MAG: class I SAM-dependent methyltransferase [Thiobacillus sp.]
MTPADYDAWYATPRGRWIGEAEYALAARLLAAQPGERLLDVGCGTGWFTRRAAADGLKVTGIDPNAEWLAYARTRGPDIAWLGGDARALPFADASFDHVLSMAALCFVDDARRAVAECVRVARRRFALGWLNRTSLLYLDKGRHGGSGAYRGARWHTAREVRALFAGLPVGRLCVQSAVFLPSASGFARALERVVPSTLPWGSVLVVSGDRLLG